MTAEDRKRAERIGTLSNRLWRLEEMRTEVGALEGVHGGAAPSLALSLSPQSASAGIPPVLLRGEEAATLLTGMIDRLEKELRALL